ncbi:hypothetical protein J2X36_004949 [Methylobacterium sp. BE186]|nr:hypothetical protein [Methylobacterium sp. BE186]MDR7040168.1 hypothetical protein [Methylobacterium sp. BE186]
MSLVLFLVFVGPYLALAVWNVMAMRGDRGLRPAVAPASPGPARPGDGI